MTESSNWFDAGGHHIHVRSWTSDPEASVVVLLHGLVISSRYMIPLAKELARDHNVYALDMPGVGHSPRPSKLPDTSQLGAVVVDWMKVTGLSGATLVANSFGCQVAVEATKISDSEIGSLVLMGPVANVDHPTAIEHVGRMVLCLPFEPWWFVPLAIRDLLACGVVPALSYLRLLCRYAFLNEVAAVTVPTYVMHGSYDFVSPGSWNQRVAEAVGADGATCIPRAAHIAHGSQPEAVGEYVREVVRTQASAIRVLSV